MTDTEPKLGKRRWVWPMRVERRRDAYQRQYILKIWLRWPTYRPYETSTKDSRCGRRTRMTTPEANLPRCTCGYPNRSTDPPSCDCPRGIPGTVGHSEATRRKSSLPPCEMCGKRPIRAAGQKWCEPCADFTTSINYAPRSKLQLVACPDCGCSDGHRMQCPHLAPEIRELTKHISGMDDATINRLGGIPHSSKELSTFDSRPEEALQSTHHEACWTRPRHHTCAINRIRNLEREREQLREDADYYRTAIEQWHDLTTKKNINGPDGPTDEWRRAVNKLVEIATGESHE